MCDSDGGHPLTPSTSSDTSDDGCHSVATVPVEELHPIYCFFQDECDNFFLPLPPPRLHAMPPQYNDDIPSLLYEEDISTVCFSDQDEDGRDGDDEASTIAYSWDRSSTGLLMNIIRIMCVICVVMSQILTPVKLWTTYGSLKASPFSSVTVLKSHGQDAVLVTSSIMFDASRLQGTCLILMMYILHTNVMNVSVSRIC